MSKLYVEPAAVLSCSSMALGMEIVLVWRAVLVRFEVVEVVGVLVDVLVSMTSTAGDMPCFGGLLTWWSVEA